MVVLVTGGAGYIGSHSIIELLEKGHEVVSVDNYAASSEETYTRIQHACGKTCIYYACDCTDYSQLRAIFMQYRFDAVMHFAAFKLVGESVQKPLLYFRNNIDSLVNVLQCMDEVGCKRLIFSSSCSVYGNPETMPVTEQTPFGKPESPYAATKQVCEILLQSFLSTRPEMQCISLRYFNPVGAHLSGLIGEIQLTPNNLLPVIMHSVIKNKPFTVFGKDYPTPDGTCVRDYIHVSDIGKAHELALHYFIQMKSEANYEVFNLGTEKGNSVLELIKSFEEASGISLQYSLGNRRDGDVSAIYADTRKARELLGWSPTYTLSQTMETAWKWLQQMKQDNLLG